MWAGGLKNNRSSSWLLALAFGAAEVRCRGKLFTLYVPFGTYYVQLSLDGQILYFPLSPRNSTISPSIATQHGTICWIAIPETGFRIHLGLLRIEY